MCDIAMVRHCKAKWAIQMCAQINNTTNGNNNSTDNNNDANNIVSARFGSIVVWISSFGVGSTAKSDRTELVHEMSPIVV